MLLETYTNLLVLSGALGLSCWAVGLIDHMYRLGLPQNRRTVYYNRCDNAFMAVGSLLIVAFVSGLYYLVVR